MRRVVMATRHYRRLESRPIPTRVDYSLGGPSAKCLYIFSGFLLRLRPVSVDAITTRTAATAMATIQRTQSTPEVPLPPKAV